MPQRTPLSCALLLCVFAPLRENSLVVKKHLRTRLSELLQRIIPRDGNHWPLEIGSASCREGAFRSVVLDTVTNMATCSVGRAITTDSTADCEYEECLVKGRFLCGDKDLPKRRYAAKNTTELRAFALRLCAFAGKLLSCKEAPPHAPFGTPATNYSTRREPLAS